MSRWICRVIALNLLWSVITSCIACSAVPARADEGMWLFNKPPAKALRERYGFSPTQAWLNHLQRSSIRFGGGSGSFVSSDALVLTNHHVAAGAIEKLSTPEKDLLQNGFYARTRDQELRCHAMELNVLINIEDVTARVHAAVKGGMGSAAAFQARRAVMNTIEKESTDKTGLRSDVVTLYHGGLYHLYRYKKYTDVRLVFAPEQAVAFFGGDPDNFEYPRHDLDVSFLRVYEDGKPAKVEHFLTWSQAGAAEDELVFVCGHPGRTDRLNTLVHLKFLRDCVLPASLDRLRRREVLLTTFSQRSRENARRAGQELFGAQNGRKARLGNLAGLQGPVVLARKKAQEDALRQAVQKDPKLQAAAGQAWDDVAAAIKIWGGIYQELELLENDAAFNTRLFGIARTLVRLAEETTKPNDKRLREYRESNLDSLKHMLFSEAPIYKDLETVKLADSLGLLMEKMGADNELVRKVLAGKSPQERAGELIGPTRLEDAAYRKELAKGGLSAIQSCQDPLIVLARLVDGPARAVRKVHEETVEEPLRQAYAKIAEAQFALYGTDLYPDATGTLRLALGRVKGYTEFDKPVPPWTTMGGAFQRAQEQDNQPPFRLPASWLAAQDRLKLDTPLNFVCTADIIGGNSGSPVVNRRGELVGLIFDGNIQSLSRGYAYDDQQGRALAVHASAIKEALRKVYNASALADELGR